MSTQPDTITLTVVVSTVTSAVISLATFMVGVRLAKDQGDRAVLREIYQRLFEHFRSLRDSIEARDPKTWQDFALRHERSMPPFRKMTESGEANLLPDVLKRECENLEVEALRAGSVYKHWVDQTYGPELQTIVSTHTLGRASSITGRTYRQISVCELPLMSLGNIAELVEALEKNNHGLGIEFSTERGRTNMKHLYADKIENVTIADILTQARNLAHETDIGRKATQDVQGAFPQLEAILKKLTARIRDPHPLRESIVRALQDITIRS